MKTEALRELLSHMSLEEKIGQLVQLPAGMLSDGQLTGPALEMGLTEEDLRLAGSTLSIIGAEKIHAIQERYIENHPHHIPMLFMADIINGYRTVFPIPLAQGCAFDPHLVEDCAAIAAEEAAAAGVHVTFSPMADLSRDARWGRVMEGTGEDPYLNGQMAAAMVRGYQGRDNDLKKPERLAACVKHFAAYGAPLAGRDYNTVELSERSLREDYLPAYQQAVKAGCVLAMTSFNTLGRVPSAVNRWLLRDVLRREMGFDGVIISDWAALHELLAHGIAADHREAARLALNAGVEIDMSTPVYCKHLKGLVEDGTLPVSLIDEAAFRVLTLKNRLGLFENSYRNAGPEAERKTLLSAAHRQKARECAEKTFVLLKNDNDLLPLSAGEQVACIGPYVEEIKLNGAWSIFSEDTDTVPLRQGLETLGGLNIRYAQGSPMLDPGSLLMGFQTMVDLPNIDAEAALREAVALAKTADKVVLALGEPREYTGEASSRAEITLPECQLALLREVARVNRNVIVVLFCGRPLDIRPLKALASAILVAWMPGTEGGPALARVLYGQSAPSGKLDMSFPYCTGQTPVYYGQLRTGRPFRGDYRTQRFFSKYLDIPNEPLYPFGYGLSYTSFAISPVRLSQSTLRPGEALQASVTVTNTGKRPGVETVQLYIRDDAASVARPDRELRGFQKVTLEPGQSREVSFDITEDMLRFYDLRMAYVSEAGAFQVFIGSDSTTENGAAFELVK